MRVNLQFNTNSNKANNPLNIYGTKQTKIKGTAEVQNGHVSLKSMLKEAQKEQKNQMAAVYSYMYSNNSTNSIFSSSMSYSEKLRAQRENSRYAELEKKKLKYQFKDISSKIIRSKTSQAARQAVSSARRELIRLKQEKQSGKYDPEEIEAAIAHAKTMERVARKKVRHLEEEEMVKAAGGPCSDAEIDQERAIEEDNKLSDEDLEKMEGLEEGDLLEMEDDFDEEEISNDDFDAMLSEFAELSSQLMADMEDEMQDMMEEMGLDELSDSIMSAKKDMDPEDFKMMKIKHRCKEMKEMTKADSDYLKAVFEHLEKMRTGGGGVPLGNSAGAPTVQVASVQVAVPTAEVSQAPVIDVAL